MTTPVLGPSPERTAAQDIVDRVAAHLCRALPRAHERGLRPETVRAAVAALVTSQREDLTVVPVGDDRGLAAVLMVKERQSVLSEAHEGFVYCLVPCRTDASMLASTVERLDQLMSAKRWEALRVSLLAADMPALAPLLAATNLTIGWMVARKDLDCGGRVKRGLPGTARLARYDDLDFVCAGWREAFAAGLQAEASWPATRSPAEAADLELARLLDSEHCVLLVIESAGERVGFVAAEAGVTDALTGGRECHVHDCYVVPRHRGRGYSERGTGEIEQIAREAGCDYLTGTVTGPSAASIEAILARLGEQGWVPDRVVYRCRAPLRSRP